LNTDKIERSAVRKIEEIIDKNQFLKPFIEKGGSFPIWDGSIFIYNSSKARNDNLEGRINIQVKGTQVSSFSGDTFRHPFRVSDLNAYLKDSGVLYFVVQVLETGEAKAYYRSFLPIDLDRVLKELRPKQMTKTEELKFLDDVDGVFIGKVCKEFLYHREMQQGTFKYRIKHDELGTLDRLEFTVFNDNTNNLFDNMFKNPIMLYGYRKDLDIPFPIDYIDTSKIMYSQDNEISVNGKTFYKSYQVEKYKDRDIVKIGNGIRLDLKNKTVKLENVGNIYSLVRDYEFLSDLSKNGHFELNGQHIIKINLNQNDAELVNNNKKYLENIVAILEYFKVNDILIMESLSENDYKLLYFLINTIIYNNKTENESIKEGISFYTLGNVNIFLYTHIDNDGNIIIRNLFDCYKKLDLVLKANPESNPVQSSVFLLFNAEALLMLSDKHLPIVEEHVLSIPYSSDYATYLNLLVLETIKSYDISEKVEFLDLADAMASWLIEGSDDSDIFLMNKMQILKRQRELSKEEKEKLRCISCNNIEDYMILCGINILLENWSDFDYYFEKLNTEQREMFKSYPIFRFVEDKNKTVGI